MSKLARRDLQLALGKLDQMDRTENDADHLADLWAEFLTYANRVFNKLSHGPKHSHQVKDGLIRVKHVRKTDKILSYILHARNADTHGVERIAQDSNLVSVKICPLSSYKDDEPIKGKIVDNAIVGSVTYEFIQHAVQQTNPVLRLVPVTDSGMKYDPPAPGTYLDEELSQAYRIDFGRIVANYLERIVAEAENHVVPEPS